MTVLEQIKCYIDSQREPKRSEMQALHELITHMAPSARLWFLDGKNDKGKVISNPNIGYGCAQIPYSDGPKREFYQVGFSANSTGISVYIMGLDNKKLLSERFGPTIGKASVTGYCIKFRSLAAIDVDVLREAIAFGLRSNAG